MRWYYIATPLFWLVGVIWGVNVRVAFLDEFPVGRNAVWYLRMLDWAAGPSVAVRVVTPTELVSFVLTSVVAGVSYGLQKSAMR